MGPSNVTFFLRLITLLPSALSVPLVVVVFILFGTSRVSPLSAALRFCCSTCLAFGNVGSHVTFFSSIKLYNKVWTTLLYIYYIIYIKKGLYACYRTFPF